MGYQDNAVYNVSEIEAKDKLIKQMKPEEVASLVEKGEGLYTALDGSGIAVDDAEIVRDLLDHITTQQATIDELQAFVRKCSRMTSLQPSHNKEALSLLPLKEDES